MSKMLWPFRSLFFNKTCTVSPIVIAYVSALTWNGDPPFSFPGALTAEQVTGRRWCHNFCSNLLIPADIDLTMLLYALGCCKMTAEQGALQLIAFSDICPGTHWHTCLTGLPSLSISEASLLIVFFKGYAKRIQFWKQTASSGPLLPLLYLYMFYSGSYYRVSIY